MLTVCLLMLHMFFGRLKPGCENQLQEIEMELSCRLEKVGWLPGFYSIPPNVQIAGLKAYREGKVRKWLHSNRMIDRCFAAQPHISIYVGH